MLANVDGDVNAGFISTGSGAVVFDTGANSEQGEAIARAVREVTGEDVAFVVNSHWHRRHSGGNSAFTATFLHHRVCYERMRDEGRTTVGSKGSSQVIFSKDGFVKIGSLFFEIHHTEGHAPGSVVLVIPDEGVAFTGDELVVGRNPSAVHSDLRTWSAQLAWLESLSIETFIPGHGPVGTVDDVRALRNYFESLISNTSALKRAGLPVEEVLARGDIPLLAPDPSCPYHRRNVEVAFKQVA